MKGGVQARWRDVNDRCVESENLWSSQTLYEYSHDEVYNDIDYTSIKYFEVLCKAWFQVSFIGYTCTTVRRSG